MEVQFVLSLETWIWNAVAEAVSHCKTTWLTVAVDPRSTCSHCGSENTLDQRVPVLPSVAAEAAVPAFSAEGAVVGWPWDSRVAAWARPAVVAVSMRTRPTTAILALITHQRK